MITVQPDMNRPSILAPFLTTVFETIDEALRTIRYQPDDPIAVQRFIVAGRLIERLQRHQTTLREHPKSAKQLAGAWSDTQAIAHALLDPTLMVTPAGSIPIRVHVPGPTGLLRDGLIDVTIERGRRVVRWEPTDNQHDGGQELHQVTRRHNQPHRFETGGDWERLAGDIIAFATGWAPTASPTASPMPTTLATTAPHALARQLRDQFRTGEWTITTGAVREWLHQHRYITLPT